MSAPERDAIGLDVAHVFGLTSEQREAREVEQRLIRERARDRAIGEAEASHALADMAMPDDLRCYARRHGVEHLMEVVWRNGWQSGWRMGLKHRHPAPREGDRP